MRFTIRDLLWLMIVAGFACGWFLERRNSYAQLDYIRMEHETLAKKQQRIDMFSDLVNDRARYLQNEARRLGIQENFPPTPGPVDEEFATTQLSK